jgi:hypothetical protein
MRRYLRHIYGVPLRRHSGTVRYMRRETAAPLRRTPQVFTKEDNFLMQRRYGVCDLL